MGASNNLHNLHPIVSHFRHIRLRLTRQKFRRPRNEIMKFLWKLITYWTNYLKRYTTLFRKLYNIFKLSYYLFFASFLYLFSQHSSNYVLFALLLLGYYFVKRSEKLLLKKSLKTKEIITLFEKKESKKERAIGILILIVASSYLIYEYGSENIIFQNLIVLIIGLGIYEKHSKLEKILQCCSSWGI